MKKRILLIRPPLKNISGVLPLGLMYIGSVLKEKGHEVKILDLRLECHKDSSLSKIIKEFRPDIAGIGLLTVESKSAHQIAERIKAIDPGLFIVFGGPHCKADPCLILNDKNVDLIVIGEGESTICDLMNVFTDNVPFDRINGIAYRSNGSFIKTDSRDPIIDLNNLKIDYDLVNLKDYFHYSSSHEYLPGRKRFLPIFTSRGCPFECVYCHNIFGRKIRYMSAERVLSEIEFLYKKYSVDEFHFLDDSFNIDIKRAKKIFELIHESGMDIRISFPNGIRADFIDDELIDKMKKAGVYRIAIGIESASRRVLEMIHKKLNIDSTKDLVNKMSKSKISTNGFFMIGFPTETREEIFDTINLACSLNLSTALFSIVIPNPGTELWDSITANKRNNGSFNFEKYDITSVNLNQSYVSSEELLKLQKMAYRKFYFTPRRIWNIYKTTPQKTMLLKKIISKIRFVFS